MNYEQVKRAVAVVRRSLEKESFEDFRDFFRVLGDVEDAYGYERLSDGKDDEDFLEQIMHTCNEFGYADHVEENRKFVKRRMAEMEVSDNWSDEKYARLDNIEKIHMMAAKEMADALKHRGCIEAYPDADCNYGYITYVPYNGETDPNLYDYPPCIDKIMDKYKLKVGRDIESYKDTVTIKFYLDPQAYYANKDYLLGLLKSEINHVEESRKQDSRESLKEDAGKTIQKLDALVDDMTSAGVLDFADDIYSAVNGAYQYGFEDREIREELYSVWTEMKHTRDPLILDYADKLYDIVKPYIDEYLGTRFYDESTKQAYRRGYLRGLKEAEESEYAPLIASLRKIVGKPNAFFADQIEDLCKDGKFYAASRKINVYSMQHIRLSPEKTQKLNDIHDALVQLSL